MKSVLNHPSTFPLQGKRLWVTGGHGFLGKHLVPELEARGATVLTTRSSEVDLLDPGGALRFLETEHPDGVLHLAAKVGGIGANRRHPGEFFYANMSMGLHLLEACRQVGTQKVLVLGTVCSYPKFCPIPFREDDLWNGYPEETNAPYGIAKKALLVQLQAYRQEYGFRGIFLIPVNLFGPGDHLDLETNHVIPALIQKFLEAKAARADTVEIWGTGTPTREFLYVKDAAVAITHAMEKYEGGAPVNLGTGEEISIRDLALKIQALTRFEGELHFDPAYPDGQPKRRLDTSIGEHQIGWKAKVSLEEGILETIKWMERVKGGG